MSEIFDGNFSQCHNALKKQGFCHTEFPLPRELSQKVLEKKYDEIDAIFKKLLKKHGELYNFLTKFTAHSISQIEHIISLRESKNPWEEDGIWHDDGSRVLAFSLSLTLNSPEGGILEFRKKDEKESQKIPTPQYGTGIIFKTGVDGFEHKINQVTKGSRLIIAGWLYKN